MRAGKDLDLAVAQEALGHAVVKQKNGPYVEAAPSGTRPLKAYSSDLAAAWEVADRLGITLIPVEGGQWFALVGESGRWRSPAEFLQYLGTADFVSSGAAVAETAPLAICISALKAIEKRRALAAEAQAGLTQQPQPTDAALELAASPTQIQH